MSHGTPAMRVLVPMAPVKDVARSIAFYEKLGFEVGNDFTPPGKSAPTWAWLESRGGAKLMVSTASEAVVPPTPTMIFYVYCDDVAATRAQLAAAGVEVGEIKYPFFAPRGEFRVVDPDGYVIMVTHT
jgi:catechol 2,3-dioxygenase-like lactoylglutathione lyase family enzyme